MSFPPRPPIIQMPPMPPMMPNPYGYRPMNMPPMGMNPLMQRPLVPPSSYTLMSNAVAAGNSLKAALSLPVTKVFVGNISERVPDPMMRAILQRCGSVISWKRVEGPSGKLQAFGFCEYDNPQSTLRCIRLLNGYEIAEKKLLVKVDQKTRELLGEYIKKNLDKSTKNAKKAATIRNYSKNRAGEDGELDDDDTKEINLEAADEDTHKEDRIVLNALELILRQYHKDLVPQPPPAAIPVQTNTPTVTTTTTTPVTETTAKTVDSPLKTTDESANSTLPSNKLVTNDKDLTATRSKSIDKQKERDRDRDRRPRDQSPVNDRYRGRNNSRSIERDSVKTNKPYHNSRSRTRSRSPIDHNRRVRRTSNERSSYRDDTRNNKNSSPPSSRFSRNNTSDSLNKETNNSQRAPAVTAQVSNLTPEEQEEERERKKLERRLREKELAYRERLKQWEEREQKKRHQYLAEKKVEIQKRRQLIKEAKKLRQFMEDYEDDKDDSNFFKGSNLEKKLKAREKEIEADNRDRQREKEELDELKKKLAEKGFADVESEAKKIHDDEHIRMKTKFEKLEQSSSSSSSSSSEEDVEEDGEDNNRIKKEIELEEINNKDEANNNTDSINNNKDKIEPSEQENELEINKNLLTPQNEPETNSISKAEQQQIDSLVDTNKNLMSDGDSSSSPFINSNNSNYNDSPAVNYSNKNEDRTIENYSLSSPNSNSPLYLNNSNLNNTNNHYLPGSTATHVTIKSFTKKSIQPVIKAFADEDDEANGPQLKRPKLIGSLNDQESKMNSDERKKAVKKLVESIPTDRDDLFSYVIDWDQLDEALMDKRIKPWINKKIIEYIGEEEATLNDFICTKIQQRTKPERLLEEVKVILDDEAELFIKKMWRLIVYETESKRQGLSK